MFAIDICAWLVACIGYFCLLYAMRLYVSRKGASYLFRENSEILISTDYAVITMLGGNRRQAKSVRLAISRMTPGIQRAVSKIRVYRHFSGKHIDPLIIGAHFHHDEMDESEGVICLRRGLISAGLIWHEAAHAYESCLPVEALAEWVVIAESGISNPYDQQEEFMVISVGVEDYVHLFGDKGREIYHRFFGVPIERALVLAPRNVIKANLDTVFLINLLTPWLAKAILTLYGETNCHEDIAVWVQYIYAYLYSARWKRIFNPLRRVKWDFRAKGKVDWLLRWGFLSESDYQKLEPLMRN